ncbi:hypothetical protein EDC04DRAFT_2811198 [Pisolithus marmoratus]|nr:hypothetical protein EDC04DRAFT_2811198 [Pisolithus marmoratus]
MSFALPARQVTFGRPAVPYHPQQAQAQASTHGLALPGSAPSMPVSVPAPVVASAPPPPPPSQPNATTSTSNGTTTATQHITAVEGIVPTLQNIVATVNLDCKLDLKTIALHARNAEYNPKVRIA